MPYGVVRPWSYSIKSWQMAYPAYPYSNHLDCPIIYIMLNKYFIFLGLRVLIETASILINPFFSPLTSIFPRGRELLRPGGDDLRGIQITRGRIKLIQPLCF